MGRLIYLMNVSLDGYIETTDHSPDWATTDDEIHSWFNDELRATQALLWATADLGESARSSAKRRFHFAPSHHGARFAQPGSLQLFGFTMSGTSPARCA